MSDVRYLVSGDSAVCVEFGNEISPEINRKIRAFKIALEKEQIEGIVETVPTYRSLLVVYDREHPDPAANGGGDSRSLRRGNGAGSGICGRT